MKRDEYYELEEKLHTLRVQHYYYPEQGLEEEIALVEKQLYELDGGMPN